MSRDTFDMFEKPERGRFGDNETQHRPGRGPRVTGASDLVDVTLVLRNDSKPKAIAVSDPAKSQAEWIWLPRSQIEIDDRGGGIVVVSMPSWLAQAKGLI